MAEIIDLALGRGCHFCGQRDTRNVRVRCQGENGPEHELTVPLCARHRLLLQSAGAHGRLYKATRERWWYLPSTGEAQPDLPAGPAGCPASALLR
jgi:hypothetical protein